MNILHITSEISPYSKTGGLADVVSALPKALRLLGHRVSVLSPFYPEIADRAGPLSTPVKPLQIHLGGTKREAQVHQYTGSDGVRHFFLDIPELFDRPGLYGERNSDYPDNAIRFAALSKAAVGLNAQYDIGFDVVHCHDWQTALTALFRETSIEDGELLKGLAVVYTIHNLAYQGRFDMSEAANVSIPERYLEPYEAAEFHGGINFMKTGILLSHVVSTVSPTYAEEICTPEHGAGLDGVLERRRADLFGILNGVDYLIWSPDKDSLIPFKYTASSQNGKRRCKAQLQTQLGLNIRPRTPLVGVVSRLAEQKGIDLLVDAVKPLLAEGKIQLVVLGTGDEAIETACKALQEEYPKAAGIEIDYDEKLAHLIFAGSDIFAMPSRFEPCGLSQLYAMRYGSIPVVRDTGGLHDTVEDFDLNSSTGTGFRFADATTEALTAALSRAVATYNQARRWRQLVTSAMKTDFSWKRAAEEYIRVYRTAMEKARD